MIIVSYEEPDIILNAMDSEGGNALALLLSDNNIKTSKKKIVKGRLHIAESEIEYLKFFISKEKVAFKREQSFLDFVSEYKAQKGRIRIIVKAVRSKIIGDNIPITEIQKETRFFVKAAVNTPRYKEGKWDGYVNLFDRRGNTFPTGLLKRVTGILDRKNIKYDVDYQYERKVPKEFHWEVTDGFTLDKDQIDSIKAAVKYGRGIVKAPTGFGNIA